MPAQGQRAALERIAHNAMVAHGLAPDFPPAVEAELAHPPPGTANDVRDLRDLPWSSIDNPESRDLDQVEVTAVEGGLTHLLIGLAEVEAMVPRGSAIDEHAHLNTTSVYTPAKVFPMLPEILSTDRTSLNPDQDRVAIVVDMALDQAGVPTKTEVYRARVRNRARRSYPDVAAWLDGAGPLPPSPLGATLEAQLRTQDRLATLLRARQHEEGALEFSRIEVTPRLEGDHVRHLDTDAPNRARDLIESFMVTANGATARFLASRGYGSIRRVVRSPARWPRIVEIAKAHGAPLPDEPDARALAAFLRSQRTASPSTFADLSLSIIKLLGGGEYVAGTPGGSLDEHFALAVSNYTHSTAPNRRYPDLVTQRIVTAATTGSPAPYTFDELTALAAHCTRQEDEAAKVERLVRKAAAAMWLSDRIGDTFDAVVTGAGPKGTWARIAHPPVDGRLEHGAAGLDVGDTIRVKLVHVDPERGFIDFAVVGRRS